MRQRLLLPLLLLACAGCIEESPFAHQGQPRSTAVARPPEPSASTPAPSATSASPAASSEGVRPAGAVFDSALQVVGYRIDPPRAAPGATVTITLLLRALAPISTDEMMFVHVDDAEGRPERANGDHWPAGHKAPSNTWKVGEVIRDQFQVTLNGFADSSSAVVWMGFYDPNRDVRMTLTNAAQVKNDGQNRFALAEIPLR